jgi:hypothetical protein
MKNGDDRSGTLRLLSRLSTCVAKDLEDPLIDVVGPLYRRLELAGR